MHEEKSNTLVVSYLTMRRFIGLVGLLLPVALIGGGYWQSQTIQSSLSMYYYTGWRDVFVGGLVALGVFFLCYRGHKGGILGDRVFAFLAGVGALGMAFVPMPRGSYQAIGGCDISAITNPTLAGLKTCGHVGFAGLFFFSLVIFSLFLFRRKNGARADMSPRKKRRNRTFAFSGLLMMLAIGGIFGMFWAPADIVALAAPYDPVIWLETLAVVSFAWAWLAKGGAVPWLRDNGKAATNKKAVSSRQKAAAKAAKATMAATAAELASPEVDEFDDGVMEASEDGVVKLNRRQARRIAKQAADARGAVGDTQAA